MFFEDKKYDQHHLFYPPAVPVTVCYVDNESKLEVELLKSKAWSPTHDIRLL